MNKKDLISKTTSLLRENNVRKPLAAQKTVFHISDDNGNSSDFTIKKSARSVIYTFDDVAVVIDALLAVVEDSIKKGEDISIHGFGSLGVHYRPARATKHPVTGEPVKVPERYVPKFDFGNTLRMAAKCYELSLSDRQYLEEDGD